MHRIHFLPLTITFLVLVSCQTPSNPFQYVADQSLCQEKAADTIDDYIPIQSIHLSGGTSLTNEKLFIQTCEAADEHPLVMGPTTSLNHTVVFRFDAIYPIQRIEISSGIEPIRKVDKLSIDFSTNGVTYTRKFNGVSLNDGGNILQTNGAYAQAIKFIFSAKEEYLGFSDVRFVLAEGFVASYDQTFSSYFLRTSGWSGADGIFSYDLANGGDEIGVDHPTTGFIFSDTFVGEVDPTTLRRQAPVTMINNSFGYLDHQVSLSKDAFTFEYDILNNQPTSPVIPDAFIGHEPRNLLDSDGFYYSQSPQGQITNLDQGHSWLSASSPATLLFDFYSPQNLASLYLWNYNANRDLGAKTIAIYAGQTSIEMTKIGEYRLAKASGNNFEPYTLSIALPNLAYRYLKLEILEGYDQNVTGLGKIIFYDDQNQLLFANVSASSVNEAQPDAALKPRLWLQDGFVDQQKLYNFPLLIKNDNGFFSVDSVGLVEIPIASNRFAYEDATYYSTPLMTRAPDNGVIYFGAGVMDHRLHDEYIYVYGYKDLQGRHLLAARMRTEDILNFNRWQYFDGNGWSNHIHDAQGIIGEVSAELSVTRIHQGFYQGKYMLTVMKSTISGSVAYAIGDSPVGPFGEYQTFYQTLEHTQFKGGFTYNAKLHPNLSKDTLYRVSYNVNSNDFPSLGDANIYYPRFLSLIPIKSI